MPHIWHYHSPEEHQEFGRKFLDYLEDEWIHLLASGTISVATKNPLAGLFFHLGIHLRDRILGLDGEGNGSIGIGAPSGSTPTAPSTSLQGTRRQGRESSEPGKHGVSRQSSQRRDRARRKSCPKGHYWSYKERKCVKSKFRRSQN